MQSKLKKIVIDGSSTDLNFVLGDEIAILIEHNKTKSSKHIAAGKLLGPIVPRLLWHDDNIIFMEYIKDKTAIEHRLLNKWANCDITIVDLAYFMSKLSNIKSDVQTGQNDIMHDVLVNVSPFLYDKRLFDIDWSDLPIVFTHGDLNRMNIMLDSDGHITSVIDWECSKYNVLGCELYRYREFCDNENQRILFFDTFWSSCSSDYLNIKDKIELSMRLFEIKACARMLNPKNSVKIQQDYKFLIARDVRLIKCSKLLAT